MILMQTISFNMAMIFLFITLILLWSIGAISGRYFDAKLKERGQDLPIVARIGCSGASARAGCYLLLVLSNGNPFVNYGYRGWSASFIRNYNRNFGDTDYRALARKRDWVTAVLFWGSASIFLISGTVMCITSAILGVH